MKPPGQDPLANMHRQQEQQRRMQEQQQRLQQMQQQQLKQMQDQQRRMQMGAAWMAQQQAQQAKQAAQAAQPTMDPRFARVEAQVSSLRNDLAAGKISSEQAQSQLQNMMIQDDQGRLWTVGFETGDWYRYNGQSWEKALPPLASPVTVRPYPSNKLTEQRRSRPFAGILTFIFGLILTGVAGIAAAYIVEQTLHLYGSDSLYVAIAVWIMGFIFTMRKTASVWRG